MFQRNASAVRPRSSPRSSWRAPCPSRCSYIILQYSMLLIVIIIMIISIIIILPAWRAAQVGAGAPVSLKRQPTT